MSGREAWRLDAACQGEPVATFFPDPSVPATAALAICRTCPVRPQCLAYALDHHIAHGVWGGMSVRQRRALLREARKAS